MRKKRILQEIQNINNYINTDIKHCLSTPVGGYFSTILLVFSLINYLGALFSGKIMGNEKETIEFIKTYFNDTYKKYPALLYIVYRHGIAHERMPKVVQLRRKGKIISLYLTNSKHKAHLKPINVRLSSGKRKAVILLSTPRLFNDLCSALKTYEAELLSNKRSGVDLRKNFAKAWKAMRKPKNEAYLLRKYSYLENIELDNLRQEMNLGLTEIKGP